MSHVTNDLCTKFTKDCVKDRVQLILASASPRRRELLGYLGVPFTIVATDAEERDEPAPDMIINALPPCPLTLTDHPTLRAWRKAQAAADVWDGATTILAADTIVVLDTMVLNKPRDQAHAQAMLTQLSGRVHTVYTGLCVYKPKLQYTHDTEPLTTNLWFDLTASQVTIASLHIHDIDTYIATGEPMDKAGAYGIQGLGGRLVQHVVGSYTAVVGLPLASTWRLLTAAGVSGLEDPLVAYRNWLHTQGKEPLPCPPTLP